jgi:hypothetical protein
LPSFIGISQVREKLHVHIYKDTYIHNYTHTCAIIHCVCYAVAIKFLKTDPYIRHKLFRPCCFVIYVTNMFGIMLHLLFPPEGGDGSFRRNIVLGYSLRLWAVNTIIVMSVVQLIRFPCTFQCKSCQLFGGPLQNKTNLVLAFCNVVIVTDG